MAEIVIPFQEYFKTAMITGRKTATTRTKRYGYPGDWFPAFGKNFVLTHVYPTFLDIVVDHFYFEEGFDSKNEFIDCWDRLHPSVKFADKPRRLVYLHRFIQKEADG